MNIRFFSSFFIGYKYILLESLGLMMRGKYFLTALGIGVLLFFSFPILTFADNGVSQKFKVTGYYSPLPGQDKYVLGSYQADLRMNGNGTHGADGTPVYVGMISAPRKYDFGTKIHLPGFGIGTVHDRGGAIVSGRGYDRLDVWMGRGDEGRIRAINWGSRIVDGTVYSPNSLVQNNLSFGHTSSSEVSRSPSSSQGSEIFQNSLWKGKSGMGKRDIKKMQRFLRSQGLYSGRPTAVFDEPTWESVYEFQKKYSIVASKAESGAGVWGPKTKRKANELFGQKKEPASLQKVSHQDFLAISMQYSNEREEVKDLQVFLIDRGLYAGEIVDRYGPKTRHGVFQFQKKYGIVDSWETPGAGMWGPKTRSKAKEILNSN